MPVNFFPLSEGDQEVIPAAHDKRVRVLATAGNVTIDKDHGASEDASNFEVLKTGDHIVAEKTVAVRGPGRVLVEDFDIPNPQGEHPDTEAKLEATKGARTSKKSDHKSDHKAKADDKSGKADR